MIPTFRLLLSAEHATALLRGGLALHLLRNLDVDLEELAHAAVEADGLALVEVGFAVLRRNALLGASVDEPRKGVSAWNGALSARNMRSSSSQRDLLVEHARDHLDLGLCCRDLLCGRGLRTGAAEEERHCEGWCI